MNELPSVIYRTAQRSFESIPGNPWIYSIRPAVLKSFEELPKLESRADIVLGAKTSDNFRFVRYWWEIPQTSNDWKPYEKHVAGYRYYYPTHALILWRSDAISYYRDYYSAQLPNEKYWFRPGINFSSISAKRFTTKLLLPGRMCDMAANTIFPDNVQFQESMAILGILNSSLSQYFLNLLNPTVNYQVIDVKRIPIPKGYSPELVRDVVIVIWLEKKKCSHDEKSYDFVLPMQWLSRVDENATLQTSIKKVNQKIDDEVFKLYNVSMIDRLEIENEVRGEIDVDDSEPEINNELAEGELVFETVSDEELGVQWISFAVGIILKRFTPGIEGELGSAIYCQNSFSVGSIPVPNEAEFNDLIGPIGRFAYSDNHGRHVFSKDTEISLQTLADSGGVAVLDAGHPDDLPIKVMQALEFMLGEQGAAEVVAAATGEAHETLAALRKFLERDFFTKWHVKWYRKRPVYWLLQSPKRLYGLYLFHERLTKDTLFILQRQYVDPKINLTRQELAEKRAAAEHVDSARERRALGKEADDLEKLLLDLEEFAARLKSITDRGYTPHMDDGVILNMAPLHEVIPSWSKEPEKYWKGLEKGDYDWAHMAMDYWPGRVRDACRTDKSLAIAHGHEEWYEGK